MALFRTPVERCATVNVQLLMIDAIDGNGEHDGREHRGDRGGRQQNLPYERHGLRVSALGDSSDIPDDRKTSVEIGGDDDERSPASVLACDALDNLFVEIS